MWLPGGPCTAWRTGRLPATAAGPSRKAHITAAPSATTRASRRGNTAGEPTTLGGPQPDSDEPAAQTGRLVQVISDDSGSEAPRAPPLASVGTTSATATPSASTTSQAHKRPRALPLAAPSPRNPVPSTSPGTLMTPSKRLRAGNRGEAIGADSPLLARPRAGSFGRDPRIKRHRGDGRTSLPQHENVILEQELAPVFHQSFSSSSATDDNLLLPLAGAGRARQLAPPSGHGRASESNT